MRKRRESLGLSRHKIAIAVGVTENTVINWEADKHIPTLPPKQLASLIEALQWEFKDLIEN
ncbi:helix-turn-helix transcriptional regulator [Leptolyngbya sp. NIES-2104]|uniref:helix-turn-helix transcriptional regulator n=1 Tax=Leptolyngbya sp. NIES-2104 TaxID=1552121 RepID=UPI000AB4E82E